MKRIILRVVQGALIGLGAVLPGISGGVLCVVFGIYHPIMELLSHPIKAIKEYAGLLIPTVLGIGVGFLGVSRILGFFLNQYPEPSVCLFAGLIFGMLPSLFKEAGQKGRSRGSYLSLSISFGVVAVLLLGLNAVQLNITPGFGWNLFCGFCMALSVIAPGMSFSTLLMPLGLYTPLVEGIGNLDMKVIFPAGIGAVVTVILLAKAVTVLMERHYSVVFHGIIGIVLAATLAIIPFQSFLAGGMSCARNLICLTGGIIAALLLDHFNASVEVPE